MLIDMLKFIVSFICTILFASISKKFIKRENQNLLFFPICFYYVFFVLPLILDIIIGRNTPNFNYYGFIVSYDHHVVELIYCLGTLFSMIVYSHSFKKYIYKLDIEFLNKYKDFVFYISLIINIMFIICILVSLDKDTIINIITYRTRYIEKSGIIGVIFNYSLIFCAFSLLPLFLEKKKSRFLGKSIVIFPFVLFICMCNGKKSIVFIVAVIYLFIVYNNKIIKNIRRYILLVIVSFAILLIFYNSYLKNVITSKQYSTFSEKYSAYRIEFGRDDTQKLVIYDELYNTNKILSYRGESLLFYPTFFIKRETWPDKPYPYATYLTSKIFNLNTVQYIGWNMTTSIYDELISNTGLIAVMYTPFLICFLTNLLMKKTNKNKILDIIIELLGLLLICLSLVVQINAHLTLNLIFIVLLFLKKVFNIKIRRRI